MMWDMLPAIAWKSVVTLGVTLLLLRALKHRSAAQRAWIAHIGLVATLALPLAAMLLPRWEVEAAAPVAELAAPMTAIFTAPPVVDDIAPAAVASLEVLHARVSGSGQIRIKDAPREIDHRISGSGRLVAGGQTYRRR